MNIFDLRTFARVLCWSMLALLCACGGDNERLPAATQLAGQVSVAISAAQATVFAGVRANYVVTPVADAYGVREIGTNGTEYYPLTIRMRFADVSLSYDVEGVPGKAYRLYRAAFHRQPDPAGLGYWIGALDAGLPINDVAAAFVQSPEFKQLVGEQPSHASLVGALYRNVLGREADGAGIAYWTAALDSGVVSLPYVLAAFSESPENQMAVLADMQKGIVYLDPHQSYVPAAHAGGNRNIETGVAVTLDGSASTASDGRSMRYSWSMRAKPAGSAASLTEAQSAHPRFTPDLDGVYELTLTVSDGQSQSVPVAAVLTSAWVFPSQQLPMDRNFLKIDSQAGESVGEGKQLLYTQADANFSVVNEYNFMHLVVQGDMTWIGELHMPNRPGRIEPGFYPNLSPIMQDVMLGSWSMQRNIAACEQIDQSWLLVDAVSYNGNVLVGLDLRFQQNCKGNKSLLKGQLHWRADDPVTPPGPQAIPVGLWRAPSVAVPSQGNYVYLQSSPGDWIGGGQNYLYTNANARIAVGAEAGYLQVLVDDNESWSAQFNTMDGVAYFKPGYYGDQLTLPFFNETKGGMSWTGHGRGCGGKAWFAVDSAIYYFGNLTELDLRFGQDCDDKGQPLNGQIRWRLADGQKT